MIARHYDKTARVDRLTAVLDDEDEPTNKKEFAEHIASVPCHIQPLTDENSQDIPGGFGKEFLMFSSDVDISEGDRIFIDEDEYRVTGTESLSFLGKSHRETRIRIFKS